MRTDRCLDDHLIAALADGTLDDARRDGILPHLAGCPVCRSAVADVARALGDPRVAREARRAGGRSRIRRAAPTLVPAAAAILVLLLAWPERPPPPVHRAPVITGAPTPAPVSPAGVVAQGRTLRWEGVPGADGYRAVLYDAGGALLHEAETVATTARVPDEVSLEPGRTYFWLVEARVGFGRSVASELVEFTIAPVGRR